MTSAADASLGRATGARSWLRLLWGVVAGFAAWAVIGTLGLRLLQLWPAYALAAPAKAFTLPMLFSRLTIGVVCTVVGGAVAALAARRDLRAAWGLGALVLALSLPVHLREVWADYPAWYHAAYLVPLLPLAGLGGRLAGRS